MEPMKKDEPEVKLLPGQTFDPEQQKTVEELMQRMREPVWFPHRNQLVPIPNPNRLHSAWIGLYWPLVHFPELIFFMIIWPSLRATYYVLRVLIQTPILGLMGRLSSMNLPSNATIMVTNRPPTGE